MQKKGSGWFKKINKMSLYIYVCVHKEDLALSNLQGLIQHKTQPNQINGYSVCQWLGRLGFNTRLSHTKDSKKKWYLMPPCLTFSIIRYGSRVKWSNPGKGVAPSPTPWCSSYRKRSLWITLDYGCQLYFTTYIYIYIYIYIRGFGIR